VLYDMFIIHYSQLVTRLYKNCVSTSSHNNLFICANVYYTIGSPIAKISKTIWRSRVESHSSLLHCLLRCIVVTLTHSRHSLSLSLSLSQFSMDFRRIQFLQWNGNDDESYTLSRQCTEVCVSNMRIIGRRDVHSITPLLPLPSHLLHLPLCVGVIYGNCTLMSY